MDYPSTFVGGRRGEKSRTNTEWFVVALLWSLPLVVLIAQASASYLLPDRPLTVTIAAGIGYATSLIAASYQTMRGSWRASRRDRRLGLALAVVSMLLLLSSWWTTAASHRVSRSLVNRARSMFGFVDEDPWTISPLQRDSLENEVVDEKLAFCPPLNTELYTSNSNMATKTQIRKWFRKPVVEGSPQLIKIVVPTEIFGDTWGDKRQAEFRQSPLNGLKISLLSPVLSRQVSPKYYAYQFSYEGTFPNGQRVLGFEVGLQDREISVVFVGSAFDGPEARKQLGELHASALTCRIIN